MQHRRRRFGLLLSVLGFVAAGCSGGTTIDELTRSSPTLATEDAAAGDDTPDDEDTTGRFGLAPATPPDPDPTPLPIDDDYRIGTLANGLTYLLRSNDAPGASLDLRLVVNAGSAQQPVGDDGSAHFLEHMLFNGTEAFPGNELVLRLQRLGISFGPDLNAFTSYDETVYFLAATTLDPEAPDVAFEVLAQWASAAIIDPDEVAAEIGVVRDELRQGRETVDGIIFDEFERIYTEGTPYENRTVIGDPAKVEATDERVLRAFYDHWYRPDNMAVVVVGDLPLRVLEAKVEEHFGGLESRVDDPPARADIDVEISAEPRAAVVTHPDNAFDNLSLDFPLPQWDRATVGGDRLRLMERAIARMVTIRLNEAFQRGDLELDVEPFFDEFAINRGLRYFGTNIVADDLEAGLEDFLAELFGVAVDGFSDDDLARVTLELLAELDDAVAAVDTIQDRQYADELMTHWLEGADIDDPLDRIDRHRRVVGSLTPDELTNHWRWLLQTSGPIVVAVGADASTLPSTDELRAVVERARPARGTAGAGDIDALMARPGPVGPTSSARRRSDNGDIHTWTFDNGVTVSFQHSDIETGRFQVWTASGGGWSALDPGSPGANAAVSSIAVGAVERSGLGGFDAATIGRFLESRAAGISAYIDEIEEGFSGGGATDDAETFFQLLHQLVVGAQVDDVAFRTSIREAERFVAVSETNTDIRADEALTALITDDDPRFSSVPTREQLEALTADELLGVYRSRLGAVDDMHVAIVGDLDPDDVESLASDYLGTLPERPRDDLVDLGLGLPTGIRTAVVELPAGTADGGLLVADFATADLTAKEAAAAVVLQTVIDTRITEDIREALGASYGGFSTIVVERLPVPNIASFIQIDGDPTRLEEIRSSLLGSLVDLARAGPSADEFERATSVLEREWNFVNNGLFLATNLARSRNPDADHLTPDNRLDILAAMTPADVRTLAASLYGDGNRIEVAKVLP